MEYKPDKFDRRMMRIVGVVLTIGFSGILFVVMMIRFSDSNTEIFTVPNLIRASIAIFVVVMLSMLFSSKGDKDE